MKRMIAFLIIILLLIGFKFIDNNFAKYHFQKFIVVSKISALYNTPVVKNGNDYYYAFRDRAVLDEINMNDVEGIIFYFDKSMDINILLNEMDFYYKGGIVNDIQVFYGYDSDYAEYNLIDNKKINVQIVENSTNIIVGYPMILSGF